MTSAVLSRAASQDFYIALISFSEHLTPVWMWNDHADAAESQKGVLPMLLSTKASLEVEVPLSFVGVICYPLPSHTPRKHLSSSRRTWCLVWKLLGAQPPAGKKENRDGDCPCEGGTALSCAAATDCSAEQQHIQNLLTASHTSHGREWRISPSY